MVAVNFDKHTINCKLVFYGPVHAGKTSCLAAVCARVPEQRRGKLTSINSELDRTLFFEYLALDLGRVDGLATRFHLYTVPARENSTSTQRTVLRGADAVVFVADSRPAAIEANLHAREQLDADLREVGHDPAQVEQVLLLTHRDAADALAPEELSAVLTPAGARVFLANGATGEGVLPALKQAAQLVLERAARDYGFAARPADTRKVKRPSATASTRATPRPRPEELARPAPIAQQPRPTQPVARRRATSPSASGRHSSSARLRIAAHETGAGKPAFEVVGVRTQGFGKRLSQLFRR